MAKGLSAQDSGVDLDEAVAHVKLDALAPSLKSLIILLLNRVEALEAVKQEQQSEIQRLRDEINRLKGEQGRPHIRPQTASRDISSEAERKASNADGQKKKKRKSKAKNHKVRIDRTVRCPVDKSSLPADAIFKGVRPVVIQDMVITTDNITFERETYYSPSLKKTFVGELPAGYEGQFGPGVKAYILSSHYESNMTESAIVNTLNTHGILISACTVSRILTDNKVAYIQEKEDIVREGLASCEPKQMDDTSARVGGKNYFTHILCNTLFTAYFTRPHKDRLTLLAILSLGPLTFKFNEATYALMKTMKLPEKWIVAVKARVCEAILTQEGMEALLAELFVDAQKHQASQRTIQEASAIIAYRDLPHALDLLVSDNAPQFQAIAQFLALCWIHEGRHYKKLIPHFALHTIYVEKFLTRFWAYYKTLLAYKDCPTPALAKRLSGKFDALFSQKTGYDELDQRIALTKSRKDALLLVLKYPNLPLHNNASELEARYQARKRDISLHTINAKGTQAKDALMTLTRTAKKLGVNIYRYLYDRITQSYQMPSLASLIKGAAEQSTPPPELQAA